MEPYWDKDNPKFCLEGERLPMSVWLLLILTCTPHGLVCPRVSQPYAHTPAHPRHSYSQPEKYLDDLYEYNNGNTCNSDNNDT